MQSHSITVGLNIGTEGKVTRQMWDDFVINTVASHLDYCTITDCVGIYQGTVEQSKCLTVLTDDAAVIKSLLKVGDIYKKAFRQDAIMYVAAPVPSLAFK